MTTAIDGRQRSGELGEDSPDVRIVGGDSTPSGEVAGRTGEHEVVERVTPALRHRCHVVNVEYPTLTIEELKDAAFRDCRSNGAKSAVLADPTVTLCHCVANALRNVLGALTHSGQPSGLPGGSPSAA